MSRNGLGPKIEGPWAVPPAPSFYRRPNITVPNSLRVFIELQVPRMDYLIGTGGGDSFGKEKLTVPDFTLQTTG